MRLVLATSNKGKVREIKAMCEEFEVIPYTELIDEFDIVEDAETFKGNALLKAHAVYKALNDVGEEDYYKDVIVLADDSGISVDALDGAPGIFSARYGGKKATDKDNLESLMKNIKNTGVHSSPAFYTAAMAVVTKDMERTVHGWMYGTALTQAQGKGGFGYDPMFIPLGYDKTLGELDNETKRKLSHRSRALSLVKKILKSL